MVTAGEASFAFYLLHLPLLRVLRPPEYDAWWFNWAATTAMVFAMILLVSVGAHAFIQRPAQQWLRRILDRSRAARRRRRIYGLSSRRNT